MKYVSERVINISELEELIRLSYHTVVAIRNELDKQDRTRWSRRRLGGSGSTSPLVERTTLSRRHTGGTCPQLSGARASGCLVCVLERVNSKVCSMQMHLTHYEFAHRAAI